MAKLIVPIRNLKKVYFKIYDVTTWFSIQLEYTYCLSPIPQRVETTDNQTMKFGQLMEYSKRNTPFWRS